MIANCHSLEFDSLVKGKKKKGLLVLGCICFCKMNAFAISGIHFFKYKISRKKLVKMLWFVDIKIEVCLQAALTYISFNSFVLIYQLPL